VEYDDLRTWISAAESMGEVRRVSGATWQEDIGQISEMVIHTFGSPAILFDDIPGYPKGHRLLVNANAKPTSADSRTASGLVSARTHG
jgi:3-polyprenyl-4-hydroxybenzoate decarboxylase